MVVRHDVAVRADDDAGALALRLLIRLLAENPALHLRLVRDADHGRTDLFRGRHDGRLAVARELLSRRLLPLRYGVRRAGGRRPAVRVSEIERAAQQNERRDDHRKDGLLLRLYLHAFHLKQNPTQYPAFNSIIRARLKIF